MGNGYLIAASKVTAFFKFTVLNLQSAYTKYTNATAWWSSFGYDYCSVTHNQPSDFSVPGTPAFTIPATAPVTYIPQPQLCTLSKIDCQLISMMYGCDSTQCSQRKSCFQQERIIHIITVGYDQTSGSSVVAVYPSFQGEEA